MTNKSPRHVGPFMPGDEVSSSKLEALRKGASKRIRGLLGIESGTSASTTIVDSALREPIEIINDTGSLIPAFSLFAVKKSSKVNYPWGPPVRTDAFKFEAGFNYVTNYDFAIADGEPGYCETVTHFPVLIRYNDGSYDYEDNTPKIGHPIGPLEDGSVSIKRCGFVVIAEPDTENKRVWIVKSNDHVLRVKIKSDIPVGEYGPCEIQGADLCGQNAGVKDPNIVTPVKPFVIDKVLNLTGLPVTADSYGYAKPVLGLGYCLYFDGPPQYKAKVTVQPMHVPGHDDSVHVCDLMVFDNSIEDWVAVKDNGQNIRINVWDRNADCCVYVGEMHDVMFSIGCTEGGEEVLWNWVGEVGLTREIEVVAYVAAGATGQGYFVEHTGEQDCEGSVLGEGTNFCNKGEALQAGDRVIIHWLEHIWVRVGGSSSTGILRQARVLAKISCRSTGPVQLLLHPNGQCDGVLDQNGIVQACNGSTGEEGRRTLWIGETVTVGKFGTVWKILAQPIVTEFLGFLSTNMCPEHTEVGVTVASSLVYCAGVATKAVPSSAFNLYGLSGKSGDTILLGLQENVQGSLILFIKQVLHKCKHIVVPEGGCDTPGQGEAPGKFLKDEACIIKGHILHKTSQMFCGDEAWEDQIILEEYEVIKDATLALDGCELTLEGETETFCAFASQAQPNPTKDLGSASFGTTDVISEIELPMTTREDPVDPSDPSGATTCEGEIKLNYKTTKAMTCGEQASPPAGWQNASIITLVKENAVVAIEMSGCPIWLNRSFLVLHSCDDGEISTADCEPCPEDSPSASQ